MAAVVGQHGADRIGHGFDEDAEDVCGDAPCGVLAQLDKGELGGPVDGLPQAELRLSGVELRDVDVKGAERGGLKLALGRALPSTLGSRKMPCHCRQRCNDDRVRGNGCLQGRQALIQP